MTGLAPLAALFGVDVSDGLSTCFIRIAMSGAGPATPLKIEVAASNSGAATTGAAVTVTATSINSAQALDDGFNPTEAAAAFFGPRRRPTSCC